MLIDEVAEALKLPVRLVKFKFHQSSLYKGKVIGDEFVKPLLPDILKSNLAYELEILIILIFNLLSEVSSIDWVGRVPVSLNLYSKVSG